MSVNGGQAWQNWGPILFHFLGIVVVSGIFVMRLESKLSVQTAQLNYLKESLEEIDDDADDEIADLKKRVRDLEIHNAKKR